MIRRRLSLVALLTVGLGVSACAGFRTPIPFLNQGKKDTAHAAKGNRIPVIASGQSLEPAAALKGVDFSVPAAQPRADWPLPGGTPEQALEPVTAAQSFSIAWKRKLGQGTNRRDHITATPIAADGKLFVMDGQATILAVEPNSGREIWRVNLTPRTGRDREAFGGGIAYADGVVYATSGFREVVALDAKTGARKWRNETASPMHGAPTVVGGKVYAISVNDELSAFDAATGNAVWTYQAIEEPARVLAASSAAVSGDVVIAPFASGELTALNAANGNDIWSASLSQTNRNNALSEIRDIAGRPVVYRGDVLAGSHAGLFASVELRTGTQKWALPIATITTPWPAGDVVYVVSQVGQVICIARDSGQVYWIVNLNAGVKKKLRTVWSSPILTADKLIVVSERGDALALNPKTGARERTLKLGSPAFVSPIAVNGMVYVWTDDAQLVAIR